MEPSQPFGTLNKPVFWGAVIILLAASIPLLIWPEQSGTNLELVRKGVDQNLGFIYQWLAMGVLGFSGWIAFSKAGRIKMGKGEPVYKLYSWASMIFCAGVSTGILYWGCIEWAYYVLTPPLGITPQSEAALEWAATYGMFHWGIAGWGIYVIPGLAIGHAYYNLGAPVFSLSNACEGVLGKYAGGIGGRIIDGLFLVAVLGASGTALGLGTPMVTAVADELLGTGTGYGAKVVIILICSVIFAISVTLGIRKGIRRLSNLNTTLAFIFLGFILIVGPTVFILKMFTNSLGLMTQNFVRMLTWTDPIANTGFVEDWSIFYWAWWVAVGPYMGMFIAKISQGRTFRQIILGTILLGSAGASLFFGILGNYALDLEISGALQSTELVMQDQATVAIASVINSLPVGRGMLLFFGIMSLVFMATSFDSTSYVLATGSVTHLAPNSDPPKLLRLFWCFVLVLLPLGLMSVGGLNSLKTTVLLSALPWIVIYGMMMVSLHRWIRREIR